MFRDARECNPGVPCLRDIFGRMHQVATVWQTKMRPDPYQKKKSREYQAKHNAPNVAKPRRIPSDKLPSNHERYEEEQPVAVDNKDEETEDLLEMLEKTKLDAKDHAQAFQFKHERLTETIDVNVDLVRLSIKLRTLPLWKRLGLDGDDVYIAALDPKHAQPGPQHSEHVIQCNGWKDSVFSYPSFAALNSDAQWIRQQVTSKLPTDSTKLSNKQAAPAGQQVKFAANAEDSNDDMLDELAGTTVNPPIQPSSMKQLTSQEDEDFFDELLK